jgi:hypothetical protein
MSDYLSVCLSVCLFAYQFFELHFTSTEKTFSIPFSALSTLEKKNKQLDSATKELEKKVKSLRQKSQLKTAPNVVKVR